jgi:UDP-glucose 4-epimerase
MILITGGLGFIGSHTVVELINTLNSSIIIIDDLSNSKVDVLEKIGKLVDKSKITYYKLNILSENFKEIFEKHNIESVIHFAAFKSVNESIKEPLKYYDNNVNGTIKLLQLCELNNVKNFIFSSSATVYGSSKSPLIESSNTGFGITNPYGQSKYITEKILMDLSQSSNLKIIILRYFNPVGAHKSGLLGENPNGIPNNLMPYILRVAIKNNLDKTLDDVYSSLKIYGNDYDTHDGTCKRDFIHVVDLALAHVAAYNNFNKMDKKLEIYNIGTGKGTSVLEMVNTFKKVNNVNVPFDFVDKRPGDIDVVYCDCEKAKNELGWVAIKTLEDICLDTYNYAISSIN